ncbi:hypothetical protein AAZX31_16G124400 [Glycine max]|nr:hypothetical protein GYH30_045044 [Glycine max]KAH1151349.1 hypothetical protein GYH30_045044 [Glycine max]
MDMREQDKVIEMPSTLDYNNSSSSPKLSSPIGERCDQLPPHQSHTLVFTDPPQTSSHHHNLYPPSLPPNPLQLPQPHHRPRRDPDPSPIISPPRTTPPQPQPHTTTTLFRYRECLKNHAASMGGHVTDGCGEFMPNGEEGTPESFKCAACECHRNFHRKEPHQGVVLESQLLQHVLNKNSRNINILHSPHSHHVLHGVVGGPVQPVMLGFGGSGPAESSSEDLNMFQTLDHRGGGNLLSSSVQQPPLSSSSSKKRFRTKFTQQQKDRMMEFAEKLGWKIQKQDEQELHQFCSQVGVRRQVFKVWMHNSKQAMKKKQLNILLGSVESYEE